MTSTAGQARAPEIVTETVTDIAGLLAWARSLSDAGPNTDPAERASYQATKTTLLARLAHQSETTDNHQGTARD
jgi:hypothetical protein